ncbi:hypothetical protein CFOL_v3_18236 [Cephalotus follicularis]|uniref:Uncharacterized protein n=1 Tax=Cephalotus follicularis TaxID=3775 RepID=A0A1Q3C3G6_CEPFO|nr:hypothetical protein CFOL_v3_18236 [Cephalotus follicularis]
MDLESESSALESVEDNEVTQEARSHVEDDNSKNNGSCSNDTEKLKFSGDVDANRLPGETHENDVDSGEQVNSVTSPQLEIKYPSGASPPTVKGYGLKKWRRIRRDFVQDPSASVDSNKALKRGLSNSTNPSRPKHNSSVEVKQNSEGSVGSANMLKNVGNGDGFPIRGSSSDSRFAVGSTFAAGTDSENSGDHSSKSSTAASVPKVSRGLPAALGYVREKNKLKNLSGKTVSNSSQRVQLGKGSVENCKKPRGERVKIENENSHSSMESDSRSSDFFFMQNSNGKQRGNSMNCDGENSEEAHASEQQFSEEVQTGYSIENVGDEDFSKDDVAANLSWEVKEEKGENHQLTDRDPLIESILSLQSVQEALQREIQKFGEIGKEPISLPDDSSTDNSMPADSAFVDPEVVEPTSSDLLGSEEIRRSALSSLETQVLSMTENVTYLESKLEEVRVMLEVKKSRVAELEAILNGHKLAKEGIGRTVDLQQEKCGELEIELEGLFQQKMEAEIEYLALYTTIQTLRVAAGDQIMLYEEQNTLAGQQTQMLNKLGETEMKAAKLKKQAEELEKSCGDILETEELLNMQRRVCTVATCFFLQLMLLVLVFWWLILQLSPYPRGIAPT